MWGKSTRKKSCPATPTFRSTIAAKNLFLSAYGSNQFEHLRLLSRIHSWYESERVLAFFAPPEIQKRTDQLVFKKKESTLTPEEERELESIFIFEHIVRLAKIRAYSHLAKEA